ncbi:hypothetical protein O0I10_010235 [Lichtheimia ornata]|uniref:WRKY domain-containing protein n=1 Tax=Lichtheimia ornata TaxID=688661 RepID=A0AAD7UV98_9FUNG|nr:uncharacterized protein O0I10_010235 [Lichtheimia ornata]KAJ8654159.1 hypothetical protein O0I10_010235 [Lichtheimia ornata]
MNGFPTAPSKSIPLYQHDQLPPFSSSKRPSSEQQQQMPSELQDVIFYYQSQPELLRLILQSKLEEDKRRAEEAKLRSKELDLIMLQQKTTAPLPSTSANDNNDDPRMMTPTTTSARHSSMDMDPNAFSTARRPSLLHMTSSSPMPPTSTGPTAFTPVVSHVDEQHHSPHVTNNTVVTSCASSLSSSSMPATPNTAGSGIFQQQQQQQPPIYSMEKTPTATTLSPLMDDHGIYTLPSGNNNHHTNTPPPPSYHPLPAIRRYDPYFAPQQRPRRRREMQAITKIVETREYPYLDGYSWKNNGNTVQKKTGNKSVYYKCSNSIRGCPVNKTVTWKGNDEYLIKYRGEHLPDCSRVQQQQQHHASLPM